MNQKFLSKLVFISSIGVGSYYAGRNSIDIASKENCYCFSKSAIENVNILDFPLNTYIHSIILA